MPIKEKEEKMKKVLFAFIVSAATVASAQVPFKLGIAGYTFCRQSLTNALATMKKIDCHYLCHKDFMLPYNASAEAIAEFKGDVFQTESRWCSVRREGSAGYEIADTGEHKPFLAHVYRFDVSEAIEGSAAFTLSATKGLIVRTLVNDFGDAVGCGAALESLRRLKVGRWTVEDAVPFDRLLEAAMGDLSSFVKPFVKEF
jgi:hypothetical protein